MFKIIKGKPKNICSAYRCKNRKREKDILCSKHQKRKQKEFNLLSYTYNLLKSNANHRRKEFSLTLQEFKDFCNENNYLELKGKKGFSASIDRIRPLEGYYKGNLQVLSLANNTRKMHEDNKGDEVPF